MARCTPLRAPDVSRGFLRSSDAYGALALALFVYARRLARWPFGPPWWAFTFPLDALAYAAVHFAQAHPGALTRAVAGAALLAAIFFVSLVLLRSLAAILRSASSRAA